MEPHAELPGEPQAQQRSAMIAAQAMVRVVACFSHLGEQGPNFAWNDALVLQSPDEIDLLFVRRSKHAHVRRCELSEQLCQLAKL